jgi:hypothetical protein
MKGFFEMANVNKISVIIVLCVLSVLLFATIGITQEEAADASNKPDPSPGKYVTEQINGEEKSFILISAADLQNEFEKNTLAAKNKFGKSTLLVEGIVSNIDMNMDGNPVVDLETADLFIAIKCIGTEKDISVFSEYSKGQSITIEGTLSTSPLMIDTELQPCNINTKRSQKK